MSNKGLEIRAKLELWNDEIGLLFRRRVDGELLRFEYASDIIMSAVAPGAEIPSTCRISMEAAQSLMDQLWQCGLRPSEGSGSAGALKATERHLEDMRRLVFEKHLTATASLSDTH